MARGSGVLAASGNYQSSGERLQLEKLQVAADALRCDATGTLARYAGYQSVNYDNPKHWVCRPDTATDICHSNLDATRVDADGTPFFKGLPDDRFGILTKVHHATIDGASGAELRATLLALLGSPHLCSRAFITEQYDRYVRGNTVLAEHADGGVLRVIAGEVEAVRGPVETHSPVTYVHADRKSVV